MRILFTIVILAFVLNQPTTKAQDSRIIETSVPFLLFSPDARAAGMGDVGVATSPDANSIHWNVAKAAFATKKHQFSLSRAPYLGQVINGMSSSSFNGTTRIGKNRFLFGARYFDQGSVNIIDSLGQNIGLVKPIDFSVSVGYARKITDYVSFGFGMTYVSSKDRWGTSAKTAEFVVFDFGLYMQEKTFGDTDFAAGLSMSNIGPKWKDEFLPMNFRLGGSLTKHFNKADQLTIAIDLNKLLIPTPPIYARSPQGVILVNGAGQPIIVSGKDPNRPLDLLNTLGTFNDAPSGSKEEFQEIKLNVGLEYLFRQSFALRAGYSHEHESKGYNKHFSLGAGAKFRAVQLDAAYLIPAGDQVNPFAETLRLSVMVGFGEKGS